eukprot:c25862_g1_i1 orf=1350-2078(-)
MAATTPSGSSLDSALALLDSIISRLSVPIPPRLPQESIRMNILDDRRSRTVEESQTVQTPPATSQPSSGVESEFMDDFNKAHLQVGCILSVDDHPVADKLFVCRVEVAHGHVRQVVAGLRKFLSSSELLGKKVCLLLNLKASKLAGQLSEAMILAGEASDMSGKLDVKVLEPPQEASIGDRIYIEGTVPSQKPAKHLSSKTWERLVPLLKVEGNTVKFGDSPLVTSSGVIVVHGLPDGASIH